MGYIETVLAQGEHVLHRGRLHWIIYSPAILLLVIGGACILIASHDVANTNTNANTTGAIGLLLLILTPIAWLSAWVRRITTEIAVTSQRVITKRGLLQRRTMEINARQIESIEVEQSIFGRVLDFGTITVRGTGAGIEPISGVEKPLALREAIRTLGVR